MYNSSIYKFKAGLTGKERYISSVINGERARNKCTARGKRIWEDRSKETSCKRSYKNNSILIVLLRFLPPFMFMFYSDIKVSTKQASSYVYLFP